MIRGSCLCSSVRFGVEAARSLAHCNSGNYRKLTGATFASTVRVDVSKHRLLPVGDLIRRLEFAPGSVRSSCRTCGSTAPNQSPYLITVSIPAALADDEPLARIDLHVVG